MLKHIVRKVEIHDANAGVVLVGSRRLVDVVNPQDWDVVVVSTNQQLGNLLRQGDSEYVSTSDDSLRFDIQGDEVGIVPLHTTEFRRRMDVVLNGTDLSLTYKPWAIGLVAPEGFLGEIAQGEVVQDTPDALIASYQHRLLPYPSDLKQQIVTLCVQDIDGRLQQITKALSRDDMISVSCSKSVIIFLLLRLLVALEERYFSGTKHNTQLPFPKNRVAKDTLDSLAKAEVSVIWIEDVQKLVSSLSL